MASQGQECVMHCGDQQARSGRRWAVLTLRLCFHAPAGSPWCHSLPCEYDLLVQQGAEHSPAAARGGEGPGEGPWGLGGQIQVAAGTAEQDLAISPCPSAASYSPRPPTSAPQQLKPWESGALGEGESGRFQKAFLAPKKPRPQNV